jgi:tetratricopeptide (TPR) repeat protein
MSLLQSIAPASPPEGTTFLLHPLIRDWLQLRIGSDDRQSHVLEAVDIIVSSIRSLDNRNSDAVIKQPLLLHMDATLLMVKAYFPDGQRLGQDIASCSIAEWFATFYGKQSRFEASVDLYRTILRTKESAWSKEHYDTLITMHLLALMLTAQGKYREAEQMSREVLETAEKVMGKEHSFTLGAEPLLVFLLSQQGKLEQAKEMYRKVVEVQLVKLQERVQGEEHPPTLVDLASLLCDVLSGQKKFEEADPMFREVVEVMERVMGKANLDTLGAKYIYAYVLQDQGQYEEAAQILREVVEVGQRTLSKEDIITLTAMNQLAWVLMKQGKYIEAEQMSHEVVELKQRTLGKEHPNTLMDMRWLAWILKKQGKDNEAERMYQEVVEVEEMSWRMAPPSLS